MISSPEVGVSISPIIFSVVDFPEPDGPEIETNSPLSMEKLIPLTASTKTFHTGYVLRKFLTCTMVIYNLL